MAGQVIAAFLGTVAFSVLFGVPRQYYAYCGLVGGAGWWLYLTLTVHTPCTATEATFFAAVLVVLLSRFLAVWERCFSPRVFSLWYPGRGFTGRPIIL